MSAKKSKGAARPKATALPAVRTLHIELPCWVHSTTVVDVNRTESTFQEYIEMVMRAPLVTGNLFPDMATPRREVPDYRAGKLGQAFTLRVAMPVSWCIEVERVCRCHGLGLNAGIAVSLGWYAAYALPYDEGEDGEAWKNEGVS